MQDDHQPGPTGDDDHLPISGRRHDDHQEVAVRPSQALSTSLADREDQGDKDELDLLAYWRVLVKRRWLILGVIAAVLALAMIKTLMTPPTYRATATLEINRQGMEVMQVQGMQPYSTYDPDFTQTQIQLLQSTSLAQRVAEDLHLPGSNIFKRLKPPSWTQRLRNLVAPSQPAPVAATVTVADPASGQSSATPADSVPSTSAAAKGPNLRSVTGLIESGLTIEPIRNTHLVQIQYTSTVPEFSAEVANAVASGFIAASMDRQVGASSYASKYLQDQLEQLRSRLEESEAKLVAYARQANIVQSGQGTSLVSQNLADLNSQLATAQAQRIAAEAKWNTVKDTRGTALPSDMLSGSILPTLQTQLATLQSDYQQKLKTFKPGFPAMLALKNQMDAVQKQINTETANIRASVKAQYDAAAAQETMLEQKLSDLRTSALNVDSRSIRYNLLKRDVDTNRQLYDALMQRYKQVSMAGNVRPSNISIIDNAQVPTSRYAPSLTRNLSLGMLLGAFLGIGSALFLEYLDDTLKTPEDLETNLGIGVLGIIPKLHKQLPADALQDPRSAFSESYRSVRSALQFSTTSGIPKSLLITSTGAGEGKTTTALTLARTFAQLGKRVLLIDADLRNPTLGKTTGLRSEIGLSSLLTGAASLPQATVKTSDERLDVILSGPLPPSPTELLASSKLVSLLTVAVNTYDQVIIDAPPVLGIADAPILANACAGTLVVVKSGSTRIKPAQMAMKRLHAAHARVAGGLLTQYDARASGYSYGGYGGYYGYYGADAQISHDE
ncbi:MAG TPA: polysaccharide biosynthesis tyrosine autokinase [Rhodanobacteraceae bacterium]|nr:polysaccharide biosynthesis tyrosine autokinase [Rhodanobacteraceae bacterium]